MKSITVLLIEDDEDDAFLATEILESVHGRTYEIEWASDPRAGLEKLRSGEFDICLIDNRLGATTGIELLRASTEALRRTPAILLTGEHSTEVDEAAMQAGAADYLVKADLTGELLDRTIRYVLQRRDSDKRIEYLAFHDPLTDLPNRLLFADRVSQALSRANRMSEEVFVVFFDLDNFKDINDTRGHAAGDLLLSQISRRIRGVLREHDTLARLGGDEFAVCIEGPTAHNLIDTFIPRVREVLDKPFHIDEGAPVRTTASFGIASTYDTDPMPEQLLINADIAMYEAKRRGKDTWSFFRRSMHDALQERIALERDLRRAVVHGGLEIHYQPFIDIVSNEIVGFEALCRWSHPELGPQSPQDFIAMAEESGLISELGHYVLYEAAMTAARWRDQVGFDGFVSVNVSPKQTVDFGFIDSLIEVLDRSTLHPSQLMIEFTESLMSRDVDRVVVMLDKVAELGVRIALDDFGTGYSSLSKVHQLPISVLKVDHAFVKEYQGREGRSMLETISTMARSLDLTPIAEGIENKAQRDCLLELGYIIGQGFAYSRAVPEDQAAQLLLNTSLEPRSLPQDEETP